MSHVTKVDLKVRDLDAFKESVALCGLEFREGQRTHAWWGNFVGDSTPPKGRDPNDYGKCLHAIGRPGRAPRNGGSGEWEIGVVAALDGDGYELLLDEYGGAGAALMQSAGGHGLPKLKQEYAAAVAMKAAKKKLAPKGFVVTRTVAANGHIHVKAVKR